MAWSGGSIRACLETFGLCVSGSTDTTVAQTKRLRTVVLLVVATSCLWLAAALLWIPSVTFTTAAEQLRQRLSWKYASIAYAVILKDVGVLLQNMYLVATAMGLAPCALGSGDSDLFAKAAGIDYLVEASVGESMLGRPA